MRRTVRAIVVALLLVAGTASADPLPPNPTPPNPVLPYVRVTVAHPVKPGEYADITVEAGNFGGDGRTWIDWGDHSGGEGGFLWDAGCFPILPNTPHRTQRYRHAYRYPGDYTVTYSFTPNCHGEDAPEPPAYPYTGTATARVVPGPKAPSNGPERPTILWFGLNEPRGYARVNETTRLQGMTYDLDGYMTRLVFSWGDRTRDTMYTFSLRGCVDPSDHWPQTTPGDPDNPPPYAYPTHRYTRRGWYTATATMVTTGCDGKNAQTARQAIRFQVK